MVLCMSSMILGGCIPSPKKQTEAITVEENPNMMYMLVGSYATPEEEGIKVYNFDEQNGNSQYISGIKGISNPSFLNICCRGGFRKKFYRQCHQIR